MPDGTVDVALDGSRLAVTMPRVRGGLRIVAADHYPDLPTPPAAVGTLPFDVLAGVLAKAAVSARPVMGKEFSGAVQLTATTDRLTLSATDRYTVANAGTDWDGPAEPVSATVTAKALGDGLRAMTGDVDVCISDTGIGLISPARAFVSRRIDVDFPRCDVMAERLPEPTTTVLMRADELAAAMTSAARIVAEDRKPARLTVTGDGLSYDADAQEDSDVAGDLDVEQVTGDPVVLGVNPQYLADALKPLGSGLVELGIRGPKRALTVTSPDHPGDIHLIQPIFLS
jgi:DNA polymerase-3 subunit beta